MTDDTKVEMNEPFMEDKKIHLDDRGMLYEVTRKSQTGKIEQVYITGCAPDVIKAWHMHERQVDRFFVIKGSLLVAVYCPDRKFLWKFVLNETKKQTLTIPPHLWHGFTALWGSYAEVINCVSEEFNGMDEHRLPFDHFPCNWKPESR